MLDTGIGVDLNRKLPGSQLWEHSHLDWRIHIINICGKAWEGTDTGKSQVIVLSFNRGSSALDWNFLSLTYPGCCREVLRTV